MNICAFVGIKTDLSLGELAALLSARLCGGIEFGGRDKSVREEVPAVFTQHQFLGLRLVLYGDNGDYGLDLEQFGEQQSEDVGQDYMDLSKHILGLLGCIEGIHPHLGEVES